MRLFVAILLNKSIHTQIAEIQALMKPWGIQGRYPLSEQLHCTLIFIGEIAYERVDDIEEAFSEISFSSFSVVFDYLDCFKRKNGETWWLGCRPSTPLVHLQKNIKDCLKNMGVSFQERTFIPHITVVKDYKPHPHQSVILPLFDPIQVPVDQIFLMKSEKVDYRWVYTPILTINHD